MTDGDDDPEMPALIHESGDEEDQDDNNSAVEESNSESVKVPVFASCIMELVPVCADSAPAQQWNADQHLVAVLLISRHRARIIVRRMLQGDRPQVSPCSSGIRLPSMYHCFNIACIRLALYVPLTCAL